MLHDRLRAAGPPPSFDHLHDADLLQRLTSSDVVIGDDSADEAQPVTRKRKPTVASVIRQMKRAGVEVTGCEVQRDGTVRIISGKPAGITDSDRNEWETVQ